MPIVERRRPAGRATGRTAGWLAVCLVCVSGFEGLRTVAYRDPVGIPTVCFGETRNVRSGMTFTRAECEGMLIDRLDQFDAGVTRCLSRPLPDKRRAALVSFAYNVGVGAFCRSSVARLLNQGETRQACDALLRWNKAAGIVLPGLTARRRQERDLCLEGGPAN